MSAAEAIRAALAGTLAARAEYGAVEGLTADTASNALPQARVEVAGSTDWSTKDKAGRELRLATVIRVARGQAARLPPMIDAAEQAGAALYGAIGDWAVGSAVHVATRTTALADGTQRATIEHRIRVLAL